VAGLLVCNEIRATTMKEAIRSFAKSVGFDAVGFARAEMPDVNQQGFQAFLEANFHGQMEWMENRAEQRASPTGLWPECRSVISLAMNYGPGENPLPKLERRDEANVSVYAQNKDYHDLVKKRLKQIARWMVAEYGCELKVFVDTAPVLEKPLAQAAGLGWQGKHTNIVSRDYGSWLFLGEIYTTLQIEPDNAETDHCGGCRRCLDICPTQAFPAPYRLDASRCISYLTIEHKGSIPVEFREAMGNRIYGCDDCLAVCPWNKFASQTEQMAFLPREALITPKLKDFLELEDTSFRALFSGSPIKRIGINRFLRNVLIACGNSDDPSLMSEIKSLLDHDDASVRGAAVWASSRLISQSEFSTLASDYLPGETDPEVRQEWCLSKD
jgi:epoxyqueuosine reductase